jgi:hypothetical protein
MRVKLSSGAATVFFGVLFVAGKVAANPPGVPVSELPPLSCSTTSFEVTLNSTSSVECPVTSSSPTCTKYDYTIASKSPTGPNVDHTVFAVAATQDLNATNPTAFVSPPGAGDNTTGFLARALHEYAIRFNSSNSKSVNSQIFISGVSNPRIGSVLIRSGSKLTETCPIATPGVAGDTFQPVFQAQTVTVAGGKCTVTLVFDAGGNVVDVTNPQPSATCVVGSPTGDLFVNGAPLKNNSGPHGITFGTGTTTCYGPPRPSIPKCVCTATPCP